MTRPLAGGGPRRLAADPTAGRERREHQRRQLRQADGAARRSQRRPRRDLQVPPRAESRAQVGLGLYLCWCLRFCLSLCVHVIVSVAFACLCCALAGPDSAVCGLSRCRDRFHGTPLVDAVREGQLEVRAYPPSILGLCYAVSGTNVCYAALGTRSSSSCAKTAATWAWGTATGFRRRCASTRMREISRM